jgi:hypothetical protein
MEQLGSHWTYFHEILYLSIFRKYVEKIKVSLKSDKNNGYHTWRPVYIFDHTSLSSSWNEKYSRQNQNAPFMFNNFFNRAVYEIMWKNIAEPERPQMTIWRMRLTCCITKATDRHPEYVTPITLHGNHGCTKAPQCYIIQCVRKVAVHLGYGT